MSSLPRENEQILSELEAIAGSQDEAERYYDLMERYGLLDEDGNAVESWEIQMDGMTRRVTVAGREVDLAYKEYELLRFFIENPNKVLTREELMNRVWNTDFSGESRTLGYQVDTL